MTFTIPRPRRNPEVDYETARRRRKTPVSRELLSVAKDGVMKAYRAYEDPMGLAPMSALEADDATRDALRTNYRLTHGSGPLSDLRDEIMAAPRLRKCPMCSRGDVASLDHYLPKERYPELSILSLNLVPACSACNANKRSAVGTEAGGRFIHAYFDVLPPDVPLYLAEVQIESPVVAIFSVNSRLPDPLYRNACFHFEKLHLGELYGVGAAQELWDCFELFVAAHGVGGESAVRGEAKRLATRTRTRWGLHSWRAALFDAVADSDAFCSGGFTYIDSYC